MLSTGACGASLRPTRYDGRRFGDLDHGLLTRCRLYIALTWMHPSGLRVAALTVVTGLVAGGGLAIIAALCESGPGEDGG